MLRTLSVVLGIAVVVQSFQNFYSDYDNAYGSDYDGSQSVGYGADSQYYDYDYGYSNKGYSGLRHGLRDRGQGDRYDYRYYHGKQSSMAEHEKSYGHQPQKVFVPVVIKKKGKKKTKILTTHNGFYVPGGTQMFGKFKDLHSCQKACEITPTCFAGDFNPWIGKCYLHSNVTACASMRSHKAITHFKKVPCQVLESSRGYVLLGASVTKGLEMKGIDSLQDCIKKCATAGGGVAATRAAIGTTPQLCCNLNYDFASHKCYFNLCVDTTTATAQFCQDPVGTPLNAFANPSSISITICPLAAK